MSQYSSHSKTRPQAGIEELVSQQQLLSSGSVHRLPGMRRSARNGGGAGRETDAAAGSDEAKST